MKKLSLLLLISIMIFSCKQIRHKKEYTIQVQYFYQGKPSSQTDTIKYNDIGENRFFLEKGDLVRWNDIKDKIAISSGISWFKVLSILDKETGQQLEIK